MQTIWRDANGAVINIGDWDYRPLSIEAEPPEGMGVVLHQEEGEPPRIMWQDADGNMVEPPPPTEVITNPLPAGATSAVEEVVTGWDGGLYAASDPRANRS